MGGRGFGWFRGGRWGGGVGGGVGWGAGGFGGEEGGGVFTLSRGAPVRLVWIGGQGEALPNPVPS